MGAPSVENFKMTLWSNQIRNCPVTEKDTELSEKIFGPDMESLKGKSVRTQTEERTDNTVAVLKELIRMNLNIHMCIDVTKANGFKFLTTIGHPACHQKRAH